MSEPGRIRPPLWRLAGRPLFRHSPYAAFAFRRWLLRRFGARLDATTKIRRSASIDRPWNLRVGAKSAIGDRAAVRAAAPVCIGDRCTVSQLAILSTEALDPADPSSATVAPITLEDDAWVAADTLVMPGVTVRTGAVVGARSLADADVPAWTIAVGEPARPVKERRFAGAGGAS